MQKSWNVEFEGSDMIESKSYKLKSIQNNSPELLGYLFHNMYFKNVQNNLQTRLNLFAAFSPIDSLLDPVFISR